MTERFPGCIGCSRGAGRPRPPPSPWRVRWAFPGEVALTARARMIGLGVLPPSGNQSGRFTGTRTRVSRLGHIDTMGDSVRGYLITAAILTASFCVLPGRAPSAEEIRQPREASPASTAANYNEDTWQTVLPYQDVLGGLGKEVRSSAGENLGRIVDVLVDQGGQVRAAVIDFGGFLGVGNRRVVVDWVELHFAPADHRDRVTINLTRDQSEQLLNIRPGSL